MKIFNRLYEEICKGYASNHVENNYLNGYFIGNHFPMTDARKIFTGCASTIPDSHYI